MSNHSSIARLKSLLHYVIQTAKMKSTPIASVDRHGLFKVFEGDVQGLPGVEFNQARGDDDVWIRIARLHESAPPTPKTALLQVLIEQSKNPSNLPGLSPLVARTKLQALGIGVPEPNNEEEINSPIRLDDLPVKDEARTELNRYIDNLWQPWAEKEKYVRKTISLYSSAFAVHQMLQGNLVDAPLELVMGVGVALWEKSAGKVCYPILTKQVELSVDEVSHAIELRPRTLDAQLELEIYSALDNPGVAALSRAGKTHLELVEGALSPFEPSTYEPVLRAASSLLDGRGAYRPAETTADDRRLPTPRDYLQITDTWVLFARPRTASLFIQDIERFDKILTDAVDLGELSPAAMALVSDPSGVIDEPELRPYRGLSNIDVNAGTPERSQDLFFPMPYNEEQVQIVQMLDHHDGVVVQGPPGTGKTHTIANVISHYLANGKRVLVTSMKDPALAVLQEKLPAEIRPLAISLLSSEADGMRQFEQSIRRISAEVARINKGEMRRELAKLEKSIDRSHATIARIENEIAAWAKKNLDPIDLDGESLLPLDVAIEVSENMTDCTFIPDELTVGPENAPAFDSADIVSLRDARLSVGNEITLLGQQLPAIDSFPDIARLQQVHGDVARLGELNARIASSSLPALRDLQQETIEAAIQAQGILSQLRKLRMSLDALNLPWLGDVEARFRKNHDDDDLVKFLGGIGRDIYELLQQRKGYIDRPVAVPEHILDRSYLIEAIDNLSKGKRPFGLAGIIGKSQEKRLLEEVKMVGLPPASQSDWGYVRSFIDFQRRCVSTVTRWNSLAADLLLPTINGAFDFPVKSFQIVIAIRDARKYVQIEARALSLIDQILPVPSVRGGNPCTMAVIEMLTEVLDQNLARSRLQATWVAKDSILRALDGCGGAISDEISIFLSRELGNLDVSATELHANWSRLMGELRRQHGHIFQLRKIEDVTEKIRACGAAGWANRLRSQPVAGSVDGLIPDNWKVLWRRRRLWTLVQSMDGREQLATLSRQRVSLEDALAKLYRQVVSVRTWLQMAEKATPAVRSALAAYQVAISRVGRGTGVRAPRFRKDARDAAEKASPAVPCWIMPHYRVSESLPVAFGEFDLVIIDEASQSDLSALPAILRAKKVLIVGDDQQVSPEGVGLEEERVRGLMNQFLDSQVGLYRPQMSPDKSIYDLFKVVFAKGQIMLREHFRCASPIIEYSKREFYNHELRPLRLPKASERLDPPLVDVHVVDGFRGNGKINRGEAKFILEEIKKFSQDPRMRNRTVGVVSLVGSEQAKLVWDLVSQELGEEAIERHQMAFGDARTFQGKERDIMFLSMVVSARAQASSQEMYRQRYNVAASRARDRMYLVRSITPEELSAADRLRSGLMQHFQTPFLQDEERQEELRKLCESDFERDVYDFLVVHGYRVTPQVGAGSYRIDLVVEGDGDARLALECDGDRDHGPDQWENDMRRQRTLERAGWRFWRCFASTFVSHRRAIQEDLVATLSRNGIEPGVSDRPFRSIHSQHITFEAYQSDVEQVIEDSAEALSIDATSPRC